MMAVQNACTVEQRPLTVLITVNVYHFMAQRQRLPSLRLHAFGQSQEAAYRERLLDTT